MHRFSAREGKEDGTFWKIFFSFGSFLLGITQISAPADRLNIIAEKLSSIFAIDIQRVS